MVDLMNVPVYAVDDGLAKIASDAMQAQALVHRFGKPPVWQPEAGEARQDSGLALVQAAVLLPLVQRAQLQVLLTLRSAQLSSHAGQIAFPGGRIDAGDADAVAAALREAQEEVGLEACYVQVLGALPAYLTSSGYEVTPVVALVQPDFVLQPNGAEVADVFEVPLAFLMDPANHRHHRIESAQGARQWLSMPYQDAQQQRYIWGVTAGILRNFYRFLSAAY
jgi:8-oxo-dGTP pyrophosphatase MutT (NUDIX family)